MIDTSSWKEFRVGELFSCETTLGIPSKNDLADGNINYITRSAIDNGFSGTCGNEDHKNKGNCITIGAEGFVAFWQSDDFVAGNKVYALRHPNMNEINGLFVCSTLNALSDRYSFADARVLDKIKVEIIKLPATSDGQPDWDYMESYMNGVMEETEKRIENLKKVDDTKNLIDTKDWKIFKLEDLFMISISLSVDKTAFEFDDSYDIDFIGRTSINNGIQGKLYELKYAPNEAGTYSVTQIGTKVCQYRENRWYASQNIFKLVPLDNAMNKASKFLTTVITQALKCTYSDDTYSSYPTLKSLRQQEIKLPVDDNGEPDWVYMEAYMKQIEQKAAKKLELFHKEKIV